MITTDDIWLLMKKAGATLRAMPGGSISLQLSNSALDVVADPREAYGYSPVDLVRIPPSAADISLMDMVLPWLGYIPAEKMLTRKIVGHRMMWNTERDVSVWSYRKLGKKFHCNHKAIQRWEEEGIEIITRTINRNNLHEDKIKLALRAELVAQAVHDVRFAPDLMV